jgi:hypothetical protein
MLRLDCYRRVKYTTPDMEFGFHVRRAACTAAEADSARELKIQRAALQAYGRRGAG